MRCSLSYRHAVMSRPDPRTADFFDNALVLQLPDGAHHPVVSWTGRTPRSPYRYFQTDRSQTELAGEILALTKLNWNKTQFDSLYPITLAGSRRIGEIYQWCPDPPNEPMTYAFFM